MGKSSAPPAPNYGPLIKASTEAQKQSNQIAMEQLAWAREQYTRDREVLDPVVSSYLETQQETRENARADRQRYEELYQPLENQLIDEANNYASAERRDRAIAEAQSRAAQQFDAARRNAQQQLESYGVNPGATRFAALDIGARAAQAASMAAAGNQASTNVDNIRRALRTEALNIGQRYPQNIAQSYGTSGGAGQGATGTQLGGTQTGSQSMGTPVQWNAAGTQALGLAGNLMGQSYQNQLAQHQANQQGSGVGALLGAGAGFLMSGGNPLGAQLGAQAGMGISKGLSALYEDGGAVPEMSSPTGGQAVDDVPARLTAGEFVLPKEAVEWWGQKHMFSLIEKAKQGRQEAEQRTGAVPDVRALPDVPPTYTSSQGARPAGQALPV